MNEFLWIALSLSISGAIISILIFILNKVLKNSLSHKWRFYIWLIVIARLLLPFASSVNLISMMVNQSPQSSISNEADEVLSTAAASEAAVDIVNPITIPLEPMGQAVKISLIEILNYLWLAWIIVALVMLTWKINGYRSFIRYIGIGRKRVTDEIILDVLREAALSVDLSRVPAMYTGKANTSPMLVGICKPYILIPETMIHTDGLYYILMHELTHYKRKDSLYKWLMQITLCIHWFNPVVYKILREIDKFCELSCDEAVIQRLAPKQIISYGDTLLTVLKHSIVLPTNAVSVSLCEDGKTIKERLCAIMNFKQRSKSSLTVALLLTVALSASSVFTGAYSIPVYAGVTSSPSTIEEKKNSVKENGILRLDITDANVIISDTIKHEESFFYDKNLFTIATINKDGTTTIIVEPTTASRSLFDFVQLDIPFTHYSEVVVLGERAGITLPEINKQTYININAGSVRYSIPKSFDKCISVTAENSSVRATLHKEYTDYAFKLKDTNSSVSLPSGISRDFAKGSGKSSILQTIKNCSYVMAWDEDDKASDSLIKFTINNGSQNSVTQSGMFSTDSGKKLTLTVTSDIMDGVVDFFLFDPNGKEQKFTFGGTFGEASGLPITREFTITPGTWSYNCTGFFKSGSFNLVGSVSE